MSSGMDSSILDTYLYEENNLLDQLDEMLVADEKNGDFSTDDVNEISMRRSPKASAKIT